MTSTILESFLSGPRKETFKSILQPTSWTKAAKDLEDIQVILEWLKKRSHQVNFADYPEKANFLRTLLSLVLCFCLVRFLRGSATLYIRSSGSCDDRVYRDTMIVLWWPRSLYEEYVVSLTTTHSKIKGLSLPLALLSGKRRRNLPPIFWPARTRLHIYCCFEGPVRRPYFGTCGNF